MPEHVLHEPSTMNAPAHAPATGLRHPGALQLFSRALQTLLSSKQTGANAVNLAPARQALVGKHAVRQQGSKRAKESGQPTAVSCRAGASHKHKH